jgi:hypothetical protein
LQSARFGLQLAIARHAFEPLPPPQLQEADVRFGRQLTASRRLKRANELSVRSATGIV